VIALVAVLLAALFQQAAAPPARVLDRGAASLIEEARTAAATSPEQFAALWRDHAGGRPQPAVNWAQEMVVGIFLGTRNTGGYSVEIVSVERTPEAVTINYRERRPSADSLTAQVLTFPFMLAAIPRTDAIVRFERVP
jgi:hypothetical protein